MAKDVLSLVVGLRRDIWMCLKKRLRAEKDFSTTGSYVAVANKGYLFM